MKKKVSLKEIVGTQIVYAVFLVSYYGMWVRTDWKEWYQTVQIVLGCILAAFFLFQYIRIRKYKREGVDERAEQSLKRCDSLCLKIFLVVMVLIAWSCAIFSHGDIINMGLIGWGIVLTIMVLSIVRTVAFVIMDSKGV